VWNAIVSERIKLFGRAPVVGDIVYDDEGADNGPETRDDDENEAETLHSIGGSEEVSKEEANEVADEGRLSRI
jgi:tRNA(Glu) U13 pseudouridine synthase TruD